jgi:hypothetical protein
MTGAADDQECAQRPDSVRLGVEERIPHMGAGIKLENGATCRQSTGLRVTQLGMKRCRRPRQLAMRRRGWFTRSPYGWFHTSRRQERKTLSHSPKSSRGKNRLHGAALLGRLISLVPSTRANLNDSDPIPVKSRKQGSALKPCANRRGGVHDNTRRIG